MTDIKQVIVVRKDLTMRKGKIASQVAHASMAFLTNALHIETVSQGPYAAQIGTIDHISDVQKEWIEGIFTKIVVYAKSEQHLFDLYEQACAAKLTAYMIRDSGLTEFHGVPTWTCLGIGPDYSEKIDPITGELPLL